MQLDFSQWIVTLHRDVILGTHNSLKGICVVEFSFLHLRLLHGSTFI